MGDWIDTGGTVGLPEDWDDQPGDDAPGVDWLLLGSVAAAAGFLGLLVALTVWAGPGR